MKTSSAVVALSGLNVAAVPIPRYISVALALLLRTYEYAEESGSDLWDFATEIGELRAAGLPTDDLRWLVAKGYAKHGEDISVYGAAHRKFRRSRGMIFRDTTAFALTRAGAAMVSMFLEDCPDLRGHQVEHSRENETVRLATVAKGPLLLEGDNGKTFLPYGRHLPVGVKPVWDSRRRELCVGEILVKQFRVPAKNQSWSCRPSKRRTGPTSLMTRYPCRQGLCRSSVFSTSFIA
jgi:hypothetical protein